jgi:hypothetical protein
MSRPRSRRASRHQPVNSPSCCNPRQREAPPRPPDEAIATPPQNTPPHPPGLGSGPNSGASFRRGPRPAGRFRSAAPARRTPSTLISGRAPFIGERTPSIRERPGRVPRRPELRSRRGSSVRRRRSTPGRALGVLLRRAGSIRAPTWFIRRRDRVGIRRPELSRDSQSVPKRRRRSRSRSPIEGEERPVTRIAFDREEKRVENGRVGRVASELRRRRLLALTQGCRTS